MGAVFVVFRANWTTNEPGKRWERRPPPILCRWTPCKQRLRHHCLSFMCRCKQLGDTRASGAFEPLLLADTLPLDADVDRALVPLPVMYTIAPQRVSFTDD